MAEDTTQDVAADEPHGEPDYKAMYEAALRESRKWEQRSKANAERARAYDELAGGYPTPEERIQALADERDQLMADSERRRLVAEVAAEVGVSESVVASLNGTDRDSLVKQAKAIEALMPHGAPGAPEAGQFADPSNTGKTNAQRFGELVDAFLGN